MRKISGKYKRRRTKRIIIKSKYSKQYKKKEKLAEIISNISAIVLLIILAVLVLNLTVNKKISVKADPESVAAMNISYNDFSVLENLAKKYNMNFASLLAYYFVENDFFVDKPVVNGNAYIEESFVKDFNHIKSKYKRKSIEPIEHMLHTILNEIIYFPIPIGFDGERGNDYTYGNTWGALREYGGDRPHQGTDIMDSLNTRGRIPIISMTGGTIKHIGWNELGGYRVGVLTEVGNYYYYAHLSEFAPGLVEGGEINAGDILGLMGDTGYSKKEGVTGNFAVHLHVGISYDLPGYEGDFWVNPYIFLKHIEKNRLILD